MKMVLGIILIIVLVLALRAGELYTQLARYQKYWDRVNQKPIGKEDLVYVAFGDSAAQGVGASRPDKGYVGLVAKELAKDNNRPVHVINLSKSGAKLGDVINTQLPAYRALKITAEQIITIDIGANDIKGFNAAKFKTEMNELMAKLPEGTVISDLPAFKGSRLARLDYRIDQANRIIYELADERNIKLARVHDNVENNHGIRTFGGDFFHPSDYGYKTNWAPAFLDRIRAAAGAL